MKEESLKIDYLKVLLIYFFLGIIMSAGLILVLFQMNHGSPWRFWQLYSIGPISGLVGLIREVRRDALKFSHNGLRLRGGELMGWEDLEMSFEFSSKLFGKSFVISDKAHTLQDQLEISWWNEDELLRLISTYTPKRHVLRKVINEHDFGILAQLSSSTKIVVSSLRREISFDYIFLFIICGQIIRMKYF